LTKRKIGESSAHPHAEVVAIFMTLLSRKIWRGRSGVTLFEIRRERKKKRRKW
jgi:hypothetical protein